MSRSTYVGSADTLQMRNWLEASAELQAKKPGLNIYADAKDGQAPSFAALISFEEGQYDNSAIAVYPYGGIYDADALFQHTARLNPHPDWALRNRFLPVPYFDAIKANHFQGYNFANVSPAEKYDMIYEKVKEFTYSFVDKDSKVRTFAIMLAIAGLGFRYNKDTGVAVDEAGAPVEKGPLLDHYMWDSMLIQLYYDLERDHPTVPLANIVRQYDYQEGKHRGKWAPVDGRPAPWGGSAEYCKALATFPRCIELRFDLWIADEFTRCISLQARLDAGETVTATSAFPASRLDPLKLDITWVMTETSESSPI